jgi:hypothetical protein
MKAKASLEELLQRHDQLQLTFHLLETVEDCCEYAKHFHAWTKQVCEQASRSGDLVQLNQAKVRLLDRYFEWRVVVPKSHRNRTAEHGHLCVFHIFERAYQSLKIAELSLTGPLLFLPPPPPTTVIKQYRLDSFPIGEVVEEEAEDA